MRGTNMRVIVEVGPSGSGVEFSLPLHRKEGAPAQMVNIILEEVNEMERNWDASEMAFVPTYCGAIHEGARGKENNLLFSNELVDVSQELPVKKFLCGLGVEMEDAMESLMVALRNGTPIIALDCPNCGYPHMD